MESRPNPAGGTAQKSCRSGYVQKTGHVVTAIRPRLSSCLSLPDREQHIDGSPGYFERNHCGGRFLPRDGP